MEPTFSEKQTLDVLSQMAAHQALTFGAACCERMLPNYNVFVSEVGWRDAEPLRHALDAAWAACDGKVTSNDDLREMLSQCEECAPDSEDFTSLYTTSAQDAVFAVCCLLDFLLDGDVARIVSIARFSTDSVDLIVQEREGMDPRDPFREQMILEHPLMQQELGRQHRDLRDASHISPGDRGALLAFRSRAQREHSLTEP
jgi:uncharacterized protein YjaG (DUF416 family)